MTPAMITALSSGRATLTGFYQIDLPSGTRRMLLGSTEVSWGGNTWKGYDATLGSIDIPDDIREDLTGQAPNTQINLNLASGVNRDNVAGQGVQLSPVKIWLAALTLDGSSLLQTIVDPELLFDGFVDQATLNLDKGRDDLDYTVISAFDYFFEDSEGQRLNGQFHRAIWSGEKGLDNVTGVTKKIYWGANAPPGTLNGSSIGTGRGVVTVGRVIGRAFGGSAAN
jgi:hypothetical protein